MSRGPRLPGEEHPESQVLIDLADGRLDESSRGRVMTHVDSCDACRTELAAWKSLVTDLRAEAVDPPPTHLSNWARHLPAALSRTATKKAGLLKLVADSWGAASGWVGGTSSLPQGLSATRSPSDIPHRLGRRRLLFAAGGFDLDLEIDYSGHEDPRRVRGQILPSEGPRQIWVGAAVLLKDAGRTAARARVDRRGEFQLPKVRPGRYQFEIEGPVPCTSSAVEV